ncbi:MAG: hypothetical protein RBS01_00715 [Candidatus Dojkabacteria bacterium]|jgi:hypothetical protein|nr:hypothetical protein [Candidatus Dojkabacteria bacterium]
MSVENSAIENNSRRERKLRQLFALKLLLKDKLPYELKKEFCRNRDKVKYGNKFILDKGTENATTFFKDISILEGDIITQLIYVSELDLRKRIGGNIMDMSGYFSKEKFEIIDITDKGVEKDEIFSILKTVDMDDSRVLMVRDQQKEYEEDMYDEFYYFLVEYDI